MQANAARDLERLFVDKLKDAGLQHGAVRAFAGPRRLTLVIDDLPAAQEDRVEERKGPRANAPEQALEGFLRSTGLTRDQLVERDGVLFANIARKGRPTPEIVAEITEAVVRGFPWPKSMTWGTGSLRWVRPLKRILCLFDGAVAPFAIDGIASGDLTEGHRFMGSGNPIQVTGFKDYCDKLTFEKVVLDRDDRKKWIVGVGRTTCAAEGLELVDDDALADEVSGLVEDPVPTLGRMDPAFLDLPAEVIRTSMRTHQKYFAVRDPKTSLLAPYFIVVANIRATDGGRALAAGNARVLSARLNDARFFWDEDQQGRAISSAGMRSWKRRDLPRQARDHGRSVLRASWPRASKLALPGWRRLRVRAAEAASLCQGRSWRPAWLASFPNCRGSWAAITPPSRRPSTLPQIADAIRDHYQAAGAGRRVPARRKPP